MEKMDITAKTTLGELLAMLNLGNKPKVPTPKMLFETAGEPIADMNSCTLFRNGFAIYQNGTGRTVVWLPYCTNFTFYFNKLKDLEKDTLKEMAALPEGYLESQSWIIAVTLIGDHRIELNSMNRTGSRKDTADFSSKDNSDKDDAIENAMAIRSAELSTGMTVTWVRTHKMPLNAVRQEKRCWQL